MTASCALRPRRSRPESPIAGMAQHRRVRRRRRHIRVLMTATAIDALLQLVTTTSVSRPVLPLAIAPVRTGALVVTIRAQRHTDVLLLLLRLLRGPGDVRSARALESAHGAVVLRRVGGEVLGVIGGIGRGGGADGGVFPAAAAQRALADGRLEHLATASPGGTRPVLVLVIATAATTMQLLTVLEECLPLALPVEDHAAPDDHQEEHDGADGDPGDGAVGELPHARVRHEGRGWRRGRDVDLVRV